MPHKPGVGAIFGIVSENGVAKEASPVYLLDMRRDVGVGQSKTISRQFTRPDGGFAFTGLDPDYADYAVMASDEDGAEPKNALIQDRVQPIPAHSGSGHYGEWYARSRKNGAVVGIVPWPLQPGPPARPLGISGAVHHTGTVTPIDAMINIPEIPSMPGMTLGKSGSLSTYGHLGFALQKDTTIELVLDLDSGSDSKDELMVLHGAECLNQSDRRAVYLAASNVANYGYIYFKLTFNFTTKVLRLFVCDNQSAISVDTPVASYNLSGYSGLKHLAIVHTAAVKTELFVDGMSFGSVSTAQSVYVTPSNGGYFGGMLVVGGTGGGFFLGGSYIVGPVVGYDRALSADQVLELYKALFSNDLVSLNTGYAKEIHRELPSIYYRLDEASPSNGMASDITFRHPVTGASPPEYRVVSTDDPALTFLQPSPIFGRTTFGKSAAVTLSCIRGAPFGHTFDDQVAASCWARFDSVGGSPRTIFRALKQHAGAPFIKLYTNAGGFLCLDLFGVATNEVFTFSYAPPVGVWVNIWAVVDKTVPALSSATLYVGTETTAPIGVSVMSATSARLYTSIQHVGENFPSGGTNQLHIGENFHGALCEVAMFPQAIPFERIAEIWAAKDAP